MLLQYLIEFQSIILYDNLFFEIFVKVAHNGLNTPILCIILQLQQ